MTLLCFRLATVDESASRLDPWICRDMFRKFGNTANYIAENSCTSRTNLFSDRPQSTSRDGAGRRLWLHYGAALPGVGLMTTE